MRTIGYKIAIVNNANLADSTQFVTASKRLSRAINKARLLSMGNRAIMLFGERQDGTHFPVSLKKTKWEVPKGNGCNSWAIAEPGDIAKQAQFMRAHQNVVADRIRANA